MRLVDSIHAGQVREMAVRQKAWPTGRGMEVATRRQRRAAAVSAIGAAAEGSTMEHPLEVLQTVVGGNADAPDNKKRPTPTTQPKPPNPPTPRCSA